VREAMSLIVLFIFPTSFIPCLYVAVVFSSVCCLLVSVFTINLSYIFSFFFQPFSTFISCFVFLISYFFDCFRFPRFVSLSYCFYFPPFSLFYFLSTVLCSLHAFFIPLFLSSFFTSFSLFLTM
jgi:hypothetical protein